MQISFDFTSEEGSLLYKKKMFMIVKTTGTWAGKSDDTPIDFAAFPPDGTGLTLTITMMAAIWERPIPLMKLPLKFGLRPPLV